MALLNPGEVGRFVESATRARKAIGSELVASSGTVARAGDKIIMEVARSYTPHLRFAGKSGPVDLKVRTAVLHTANGHHLIFFRGAPAGPWVLYQRGSHKKPNGWDIKPYRFSKRQTKARGKKGIAAPVAGERGAAGALRTPYGPRAHVHHPNIPAPRLWTRGVEVAAPILTAQVRREAARALLNMRQKG